MGFSLLGLYVFQNNIFCGEDVYLKTGEEDRGEENYKSTIFALCRNQTRAQLP